MDLDDFLFYEHYFNTTNIYEQKEKKLTHITFIYFGILFFVGFCISYHEEINFYYLKFKKFIFLKLYINSFEVTYDYVPFERCSICLEDFSDNVILKLRCNHLFHRNCIYNWFNFDIRCPLCRKI